MEEPKKVLIDNLHKIWMTDATDARIKRELQLDCYHSLRACQGYLLDYRTIVQYSSKDFIANFQSIWFCIDGRTFELKGAYK